MATVIPPKSRKRVRLDQERETKELQALASAGKLNPLSQTLVVQFQSGQDGSSLGPPISLPAQTGQRELNALVNQLRREIAKEKRKKRTREEKEQAQSDDDEDDDEDLPFAFHVSVGGGEGGEGLAAATTRLAISKSLDEDVLNATAAKKLGLSEEDTLRIVFEPQAVFRVRPVRRCSSTLSGHASPILCSVFSPTSQLLVTGSGDKTARMWDLTSELPLQTLSGHKGWVLCAEWEGRERRLATGDKEGEVRVWDAIDASEGKTGKRAWGPRTGKQVDEERAAEAAAEAEKNGQEEPESLARLKAKEKRALRYAAPASHLLRGHTKWITSLAWEPIHLNPTSPRLASSSKDGTVRVWNVSRRICEYALGGHSASVNVVRWGGDGLLYTASSDRCVKVWDAKDGKLVRTLQDHAHWVNTLALSTDHALRTGPFDHHGRVVDESSASALTGNEEEERLDRAAQRAALKRYREATSHGKNPEVAISGSDDHTLFLWPPQSATAVLDPSLSSASPKKPLARLTGHQKTVNHVAFSPDGNFIASASFDSSVKLWHGRTGKFIASLRGHVSSVYRLAWSADSRIIVSASKDSTIKLWDLKTFKIRQDLPGHEDEVYCVDFAGDKVASGGRDKVLKIWRN